MSREREPERERERTRQVDAVRETDRRKKILSGVFGLCMQCTPTQIHAHTNDRQQKCKSQKKSADKRKNFKHS